jgi:Na+/melibiose symporter-like transporter
MLVSGPLMCIFYFLFWLTPPMKREVAVVYYTITFSMFYVFFTVKTFQDFRLTVSD